MNSSFGSVDSQEFVLIHVSDLHIHEPLTEKGRRLSGIRVGIRTHQYFMLQAAAEAIQRIAYSTPSDRLALLVTGDLSTAGSPTSLQLAHAIISSSDVSDDTGTYPVGFNAGWPFFVVPGNYDRYSSTFIAWQQSAFETELESELPRDNWVHYGLTLPTTTSQPYPRLPFAFLLRCGDEAASRLEIVIIGLDSTDLSPLERLNPWSYIAQGRVQDESLKYLERVSEDVLNRHMLVDSRGVTHQLTSARPRLLVLLHHHPHLPPDRHSKAATKLLNAREVLQRCAAARVDVLFFGHEHIAFVDTVTLGSDTTSPTSLITAATGSVAIYDEQAGNMFSVYQIGPSYLRHSLWRYDNGLFRQGAFPRRIDLA